MLDDMWNLPGMDDSAVGVVKEELSLWLEHYGWEAIGLPTWLVDLKLPDWVQDLLDYAFAPIKIVLARVKELLCVLFAGLLDMVAGGFVDFAVEAVEYYDDRLEKPEVQLDHPENPYRPSGTDNFEVFEAYMDRYAAEQALLEDKDILDVIYDNFNEGILDQLSDSEFEAFYNTMLMFKLILMGPDNFTRFLSYFGIENQTAYQTNVGEIETTTLRLDVKTMDMPDAGTDDNVWVIVKNKKGEEVTRKLLDTSITNNLECGDNNTFFIELPHSMKLTDINLYLRQEGTWTANGGWDCERVTVTPMHAGSFVFVPIGVGGNLEMDDGVTWDLQFQAALAHRLIDFKPNENTPITHVEVRIKTGNGDYDSGTDQDVRLIVWDSVYDVLTEVDLDKYLYNDFEDGDDDVYMVPVSEFIKSTGKNKYPRLGTVTLAIQQDSDYDWYLKNVTVTPYYGNLQLTDTMDFGSHWIKESGDLVYVSPNIKISDGTVVYKSYDGVPLTYETALDDGLLCNMDSIDAGVQWQNVYVLWKSAAGRKLFFNLFKGLAPEIEIDAPETVKEGDTYNITLNFTGMWNGVDADRRNALSAYSLSALEQGTYQKMPAVNGTAKVTFTNTQTGQNDKVLNSVPVKNNTAVINSETYDLQSLKGLYDIKVEYTPDSADPQYGRAEATFDNALVVRELEKYTVKVRTSCTDAAAASKLLADLDVYGTVTGSGLYATGTRFTVTATPNTGYKVKEWIFNQVEEGVITKTETVSGQNIKNNTFSGTSKAGTDADIVIVFEPETYNIKIW